MKRPLSLFSAVSALLLTVQGVLMAAEPAGEISDPKQALVGLSRDILQDLRPGSRQMDDAAVKATAVVRKNVEGKNATFKMTVREIEKFQRKDEPDVSRFRIRATPDRVREGSASFDVMLMAIPDLSEHEKLAKINPGSKITVTGKISNAEIMVRKYTELHIDVLDAKLK